MNMNARTRKETELMHLYRILGTSIQVTQMPHCSSWWKVPHNMCVGHDLCCLHFNTSLISLRPLIQELSTQTRKLIQGCYATWKSQGTWYLTKKIRENIREFQHFFQNSGKARESEKILRFEAIFMPTLKTVLIFLSYMGTLDYLLPFCL